MSVGTNHHRSPLKWAGGKYLQIDSVLRLLDVPEDGVYAEPFAGGASVALNVTAQHVWLNDVSLPLIEFWTALKEDAATLRADLERLFDGGNNAARYYDVRSDYNERTGYGATPASRAAALLYLNRHGFNGLYRFNQKGEFNVPFGDNPAPYRPDAELENAARRLRRAVVTCSDFDSVLEASSSAGNYIYCDPPYVDSFSGYSGQSFTWEDQVRLADLAQQAAAYGAVVVVSNLLTPAVRELYTSRGARLVELDARRSINRDGKKRQAVREVLARFG